MLNTIVAAFVTIYAVLALSHIFIQMLLSGIDHRKQMKAHSPLMEEYYAKGIHPQVAVIVPNYSEPADSLDNTLASIANINYPNMNVIVVDDGSRNLADIKSVYDKYENKGFKVVYQENQGKRFAQMNGMNYAEDAEFILTIDSDTIISDPNSIHVLVANLLADKNLGAVSGEVLADNNRETLLSRIIDLRYWMAFNQERAPQSLFGVVSCCSGPFSMYRAEVIRDARDAYLSQTFRGVPCTFGDDRHLTNLVLERGYDVRYVENATAHTLVPTDVKGYLKQQHRWSKSFYRELLWTAKFATKKHFYMSYDLILQAVLPLFLVLALGVVVYNAIATADAMVLVRYAMIVVAIGGLRAAYGAARTKDINFALFMFYGFMHVALLVPTRLLALATIANNGWGTRGMSSAEHGILDTDIVDEVAAQDAQTKELAEVLLKKDIAERTVYKTV